jgi:NADPH:quinone reductase-like Zn-dependent oxidoreductase
MFAAQADGYGSAREVLRVVTDAPVPTIGPEDVLVRVHASSVNPIDCALRSGYGRVLWESAGATGRPYIVGHDLAGTVAGVGTKVTRYKLGERVWAGVQRGGTAEFAKVSETHLSHIPAGLSYVEAASMPFVGLTAWAALVTRVGLGPSSTAGKRVLITRGAGGVGTFSIQLVKAWGGHVTTTCSTRNEEFLRGLGADETVDYTAKDLSQSLHDFDVAFDMSLDTEAVVLNALKTRADASYVTIVSRRLELIDRFGLEEGKKMGEALLQSRVQEQQLLGRRYYWSFMAPDGAALDTIGGLVEGGKIKPVIERIFPLDEIAAAHELCESRRVRGKVVISMP